MLIQLFGALLTHLSCTVYLQTENFQQTSVTEKRIAAQQVLSEFETVLQNLSTENSANTYGGLFQPVTEKWLSVNK